MGDIQFVATTGSKALFELERLRAEFPSRGLYPILLGDEEEKERVTEFAGEQDPVETIEYSKTIDPIEWLNKKKELEPDFYQDEVGDWPSRADQMGIITHLDILTQKPKGEVFIALLKITNSWEAFAHLNWGGWNDCPEAAVHCAMHRYWQKQYGAEVVSITGDIVQCVVARPPMDRESSMALANEQYIYCYDIVQQGTQTIAALAAGLMNSRHWYFWWD